MSELFWSCEKENVICTSRLYGKDIKTLSVETSPHKMVMDAGGISRAPRIYWGIMYGSDQNSGTILRGLIT